MDRLPVDQKTITPKMVQKAMEKNLEIKSGVAATEHFVTAALATWNAFFSVPRLKAALLQLALPPSAVFDMLDFTCHCHC